MMDTQALRTRYEHYIECLNGRRFHELSEYVADDVIYNGAKLTLGDYRTMLIGDVTSIPDLYFKVGMLVVENGYVAARLDFTCTPERDFLGFRPNGMPVSFSENVFYDFRSGKISQVWSLIDRYAIEEQLGTARRVASFPSPATPAG